MKNVITYQMQHIRDLKDEFILSLFWTSSNQLQLIFFRMEEITICYNKLVSKTSLKLRKAQ
jgi:hypothetical protein